MNDACPMCNNASQFDAKRYYCCMCGWSLGNKDVGNLVVKFISAANAGGDVERIGALFMALTKIANRQEGR